MVGNTNIVVVRLADVSRPGDGGEVVEVTSDLMEDVFARYVDRDGARRGEFRFWAAYEGAKVGDRVGLAVRFEGENF